MKPKIILTIGASHSGKTRWAKELVRSDISIVRICPEEMATMLRNNPIILPKGRESLNIGIESLMISLVMNNYNIVLDTKNTLHLSYIEYILETFSNYATIYYKVFEESFETIKVRNLQSVTDGYNSFTNTERELRAEINSVRELQPVLHGMKKSELIKQYGEFNIIKYE